MAKALFGHVPIAGSERRLAAEVAVLRARVRDLETELAELRSDPILPGAFDTVPRRPARIGTIEPAERRTRVPEGVSVG